MHFVNQEIDVLRRILQIIVRVLLALLARIRVQGLENIPAEGGAILATNHLSRLDSPVLFALIHREDLTGLVADTYQKSWFFRWLVNAVHGIWINREEADVHALRAARDYLQSGGLLGIAPEGTRSRSGALMKAKTGVAYLADKAGVPIIPIAIYGTEKVFRELSRFRKPVVNVCIGKPFVLPPLERTNRSAALQQNTDEIMCRIAAMLPAEYRGAYADHPQLQAIQLQMQDMSEKL